MGRQIVVLDAPSNLGLRPPAPGVVPGVYKLAGALRDQGIVARLGAADGGVVTPPRYLPDADGKAVRNGDAIAAYARLLADRVQHAVDSSAFPLVLGGDCSILLGDLLALRRRGRYGLAFLDGHLDFRHPGNSPTIGAAAGEDLALATGRGEDRLTNLEGLRPLIRDEDVIALGARPGDEHAAEVRGAGITVVDMADVGRLGAAAAGRTIVEALARKDIAGYWVHLDADILDAALLPAVDSPEPGGLTFDDLSDLLRALLSSESAVGLEITVFDPDLDPDGRLAHLFTDAIVAGFLPLPTGTRPTQTRPTASVSRR